MNAKEARDTIYIEQQHANIDEEYAKHLSHNYYFAKGYLAALEGPEVKALVDFAEKGRPHDSQCMYHIDPKYPCDRCEALAAFKKASAEGKTT